jgi:hypothetical protein
MIPDEFFQSTKFKLFVDEELRKAAIEEVEGLDKRIFGKIKPHQLYSIKTTIQSLQWKGLIDLAVAQKSKNLKEENEEKTKDYNALFWGEIYSVITNNEGSFLVKKADELLKTEGFWLDHESASDKAEQNRIKKENKAKRELLINEFIGVYFEHFVCHYAYKTTKEAERESVNE